MPSADLLTTWGSVRAFQTQLLRQRTFQSCFGPVGTAFKMTSLKSHVRNMTIYTENVTHSTSK